MKNGIFILFLFCFTNWVSAQKVIDFEGFNLPLNTFLNGSDLKGGFQAEDVFLPNRFTSSSFGDFWSGWSISTMRDSVTSGFLNQYSAKPASGFNGSATYAVAFASTGLKLSGDAAGNVVEGLYMTNSTYAFNSMRDGDAFAKRFGGESGNDKDFFKVIIKGFLEGQVSQDSVEFFLADFRFDNNSMDYIVSTWDYVDLTSLGNVDSLSFKFASSDVGDFGINTPLYVCVDQIILDSTISSADKWRKQLNIRIYPNPSTEKVFIDADEALLTWQLFDLNGRLVKNGQNEREIELIGLNNGYYFLQLNQNKQTTVQQILKQ
jgi:hypothetical protein